MAHRFLLAPILLAGTLAVAPAHADDFSFTGSFGQDDDVQLFMFSVGAPSNVTLRTWSYAGGTNAAGDLISQGGFDPILALFDSSGLLLDQNDDGGCSDVAPDSETGQCWDTFFSEMLSAGSYTVSVMQYDNFAVGPSLANGFVRQGQGNFTAGFGCADAQAAFNDVSSDAGCGRSNAWAFDILNVESAVQGAIPEPGTWAMLIAGFGMAGVALRRRARAVAYA